MPNRFVSTIVKHPVFQLRFPSWPKHLVTTLTQSALSKKKLIKIKYRIYITNKTLTITFYSLSLPWNKNFGNSQEAQNAIAPTSRTINIADSFYGRERIGESNYHDSQGEFWPKLKQCLTDCTKEALPQSFRTRAF